MNDRTLYATVRPDNSIGRTMKAEVDRPSDPPPFNLDGTPYGVCAEDGCRHEGYYPERERAGRCPDCWRVFMDEGEAGYSGLWIER